MEEYKKEMLMVSAILFKNNVPVEEAKPIGAFIEKLIEENQQLKEQLEVSEKARKEAIEFIKSDKICIDIRKTDGSLDYVDEKELVDILDIDKGE